jgi:hypothetical protein
MGVARSQDRLVILCCFSVKCINVGPPPSAVMGLPLSKDRRGRRSHIQVRPFNLSFFPNSPQVRGGALLRKTFFRSFLNALSPPKNIAGSTTTRKKSSHA